MTLNELNDNGLIPPLRTNCKCRLIAFDNAAKIVYYWSGESFIRTIDRMLDSAGYSGGIFVLEHGAETTYFDMGDKFLSVQDRFDF